MPLQMSLRPSWRGSLERCCALLFLKETIDSKSYMKSIYLDNAASTPLDPAVFEAMVPYLRDLHGNPSSVHGHGRNLRAAIEAARKEIAGLIGAAPAEIFFTSGGTEADNMAIKGAVEGIGVKHLITTRIEHHAVTHPVESFEARGLKVTWLPVDASGHPDLIALDAALHAEPNALVSLMHANNELGTLLRIEEVAAIVHRHGALLHSDTVQTMAHVHYDVSRLPIHFLSASAHKFYGPKGVGFCYIRSGTKIPALLQGGGQERNMRAGTENVACIVGMATALRRCYDAHAHNHAHLSALRAHMRAGLQALLPGIRFNGPEAPDASIPTVLNVAFPGSETESMLLFNLDINGISASGGSACTSGSVKGSHVLAGIGCDAARAANSVRFSFGVQNTIEEMNMALTRIGSFMHVTA
jgi:cysteine desulfurase